MINTEDRFKMFANEFNDIKDDNLRAFAKEIISHADDYFFTIPASTSGKYHPQFDLGEGGLVRHTRCVIFYAECMAQSLMMNQHDTDLIIIAAMAHDIKKLGNDGSKYTVGNHPTCAKEYLKLMQSSNSNLISEEDCNKICGAVESHMGKWGHNSDGLPLPETEFEKALQCADYIASRKEVLSFDFRPTEDVLITETTDNIPTDSSSDVELKDFVLQFGKHKGKTLEQVRPSGYLDWMVSQTDFFNKEAQEKAKAYLESLKNPPTKLAKESTKVALPQPSEDKDDFDDNLPF